MSLYNSELITQNYSRLPIRDSLLLRFLSYKLQKRYRGGSEAGRVFQRLCTHSHWSG
jgi:hypothetical protein